MEEQRKHEQQTCKEEQTPKELVRQTVSGLSTGFAGLWVLTYRTAKALVEKGNSVLEEYESMGSSQVFSSSLQGFCSAVVSTGKLVVVGAEYLWKNKESLWTSEKDTGLEQLAIGQKRDTENLATKIKRL